MFYALLHNNYMSIWSSQYKSQRSLSLILSSFPNNCSESIKVYWCDWTVYSKCNKSKTHAAPWTKHNITKFFRLILNEISSTSGFVSGSYKNMEPSLRWKLSIYIIFYYPFSLFKDVKQNLLRYTDYYIRKIPLSL